MTTMNKVMGMLAVMMLALSVLGGEVWYIPGWNRTTETNGLAYASCVKVFNDSHCTFKGWDGDRGWWTAATNADVAATAFANEIAALPVEQRRDLTIVGHSLGGRIVARTLARLTDKNIKIKQGIMLAPAIQVKDPDVYKMGKASEQPVLLVVNPQDVVLKFIFTISGVKDPSLGADGSAVPLENVSEYSVPENITEETKVDALWGKSEALKRVCNHLAYFYFTELRRILDGKPSKNTQTRVVQGNINFEWKVMDKEIWWVVLDSWSGWKLERNRVTGHCRILNPHKRRMAWGSESEMRTAFAKIKLQLQR